MVIVRGLSLVLLGVSGCVAFSQSQTVPLADIRPGMKATGKTVFQGGQIEEFQAEILGVLENNGPKQSIILARLSGGPLASTGVMQGMSGSPVYVDGKLIGAVALSFPFAKEAIAGIRPIEEMLRVSPIRIAKPIARAALPKPGNTEFSWQLPSPLEVSAGSARLVEIATPMWFSGFTRGAFEHFSPALRAAGFEPVQGVGGGKVKPAAQDSPAPKLEPGSMISVQLMSGDMNVGADGTVTHVDGNKVYAFGHRFLSVGDTELPFARSEVMALLANQNVSFKISSPKEWMGAILQDRSAAISGELGRKARMTPVTISLKSQASGTLTRYAFEMANDRLYSPVLLQMAIYSVLDGTERTVGASSVSIRGTLQWNQGQPVRLENFFSGEYGVPQLASAAAAVPLAYILQSNLESYELRGISLELEVWDQKRLWQVDSIIASPREVRPGDVVTVNVSFSGPDGAEQNASTKYTVPAGALNGTLYFTASDALTANVTEYRQYLTTPPRDAAQMIEYLNGLRPNSKAYLRVWRNSPSYVVMGENLPAPPPSLALLLARSTPANLAPANSRMAEIVLSSPLGAISGARTTQVEVKE